MNLSDVKAMMNNRIRGQEEIAIYRRGLVEFTSTLGDIPWFLARGALLGAYRDGDLMPHDDDIDMEVSVEYGARVNEIVKGLEEKGFDVVTVYRANNLQKIIGCKYDFVYALRFWKKVGEVWHCRKQKIPDKYFNNHGTINLKGDEYPCPSDIEGYLEYIYGDWETRKKKGKPW